MESFSLYELNEYIRRVIALNFQEPIWVHGEVSQINNARGNHYLEIIEKKEGSDDIIAQSSAVLWYKSYLFLKKKIGEGLESLLQDGIQIKLKVRLDFNERYGLKMVIEDIDPNYTMGQVELKRQNIIKKLKEEGVFHKNNQLELPDVLQRIACISSARSAGYQDFMKQLENNSFGYDFEVSLYDSAVQGRNMEIDILTAFEDIYERAEEFDAIVIIRGGGSKLDLSGFDNYNIASRIAQCPVPVLTGIGHEVDETVSDMVANEALKTPTAVATYLIDTLSQYEGEIYELSEAIQRESQYRLLREQQILQQVEQEVRVLPKMKVDQAMLQLQSAIQMLERGFKHVVQQENLFMAKAQTILEMANPKHILKRGFTITKQVDHVVSTIKTINPELPLSVIFADGEVTTDITKVNK